MVVFVLFSLLLFYCFILTLARDLVMKWLELHHGIVRSDKFTRDFKQTLR